MKGNVLVRTEDSEEFYSKTTFLEFLHKTKEQYKREKEGTPTLNSDIKMIDYITKVFKTHTVAPERNYFDSKYETQAKEFKAKYDKAGTMKERIELAKKHEII